MHGAISSAVVSVFYHSSLMNEIVVSFAGWILYPAFCIFLKKCITQHFPLGCHDLVYPEKTVLVSACEPHRLIHEYMQEAAATDLSLALCDARGDYGWGWSPYCPSHPKWGGGGRSRLCHFENISGSGEVVVILEK